MAKKLELARPVPSRYSRSITSTLNAIRHRGSGRQLIEPVGLLLHGSIPELRRLDALRAVRQVIIAFSDALVDIAANLLLCEGHDTIKCQRQEVLLNLGFLDLDSHCRVLFPDTFFRGCKRGLPHPGEGGGKLAEGGGKVVGRWWQGGGKVVAR